VIVAGGSTCLGPVTLTRAIEVLHIRESSTWYSKWYSKSYWSIVEQLPIALYQPVPLIIKDELFIAEGFNKSQNTCIVFTAPLSKLMESNNTGSAQVWGKLYMPYPSLSINHYQGRLITFGGCYRCEKLNCNPGMLTTTPLIHIYNPNTTSWDCVGKIPYEYYLWRSVHLTENKILFVGGLTGDCNDTLKVCLLLTITS